jgi:hypothetical protein
MGDMFPGKRLRNLAIGAVPITVAVFLAGMSPPVGAAEESACPVSDVEYNVIASVVIKNTVFGAANGEYPMGSGKLTLRLAEQAGLTSVKLMSYELTNRLTVDARVAMLSTKVVTASHTTAAENACDGSAQGTLHNGTLTWKSDISGYRSDGTMECSGSMCGKFGAPPGGTSPFHDAPLAMRFTPFTFSPDRATFTMPYVLASKSDSPKQTTYLALSGRRANQQCAASQVGACSR